jgi:hypothetical protein
MASTFRELYDDFKEQVVVYTAALPITENQFMRSYTRAIQIFQREAMYIDAGATLTKIDDGTGTFEFFTPDDFWQPIELKDASGYTIFPQEYTQQNRAIESDIGTGKIETAVDYSRRLGYRTDYAKAGNLARSYTVYARRIWLYPDLSDVTLHLKYVPDFHAFSVNSALWAAWQGEINFSAMFNGTGLNPQISMYENTFLDYVIAQFLKRQGSSNYIVYEQSWQQFLKTSKELRPSFYSNGQRDYNFAPYS